MEVVGHRGMDMEDHSMASLSNLSLFPEPQRSEQAILCSALKLRSAPTDAMDWEPTQWFLLPDVSVRHFVIETAEVTHTTEAFNFNKVQRIDS